MPRQIVDFLPGRIFQGMQWHVSALAESAVIPYARGAEREVLVRIDGCLFESGTRKMRRYRRIPRPPTDKVIHGLLDG